MSAPTEPRRSRAWLVWLAVFALSLPAVTTRLYASDEIEYFAFLRSLWFDRDLSFDNEYRYFYNRGIARAYNFHEAFLELTTDTGLRYNFGTIGSAILWAPFYGVADLGVSAAWAMGGNTRRDGYTWPYIAAVTYGSAVYGFLALVLSIGIARGLTGQGHLAAAVVWVGTPLAFYMYLAPGMSHATSAFAVALFVAVWLRVRDRWSVRGCLALGACAALMTMVREQDAFFAIGPLLDFARAGVRPAAGHPRMAWTDLLRSAAAGVAGFAIAFAPQAWAYIVLNGRLAPASPVSAKMRWDAPHAWQVLFSTEHGFFFWTPLGLLCAAGLVALMLRRTHATIAPAPLSIAPADHRWVAACLLLMFASQVYIAGAVDTWTVSGAFGQRRFVGTTALLVVGLAGLFHAAAAWRRTVLTGTLALVAVWWNLGLMVQFGAGLMDRQRLDLAENARNTFMVVPRALPDLAARYLFDRSSFYQQPDQRQRR
jgi:hypothetical protein